jgi:heme A synthase
MAETVNHFDSGKAKKFQIYAWSVLLYTLAVIAWGAYVRASGSGAGCGSHWPLCNGEAIPQSTDLKTLIEFSHRLTSGLSLLLVAVMTVLAFKRYPKGHIVRTGAIWSLIFILGEALVGASLVLLELVAENKSAARAVVMAFHLVNTFVLLYWLTFTAWFSCSRHIQTKWFSKRNVTWLLGMVAIAFAGASGAIAALGDTLFPAATLREGFYADLDPSSHFLLKLRIWHPMIAIGVVVVVLIASVISIISAKSKRLKRLAILALLIVILQFTWGVANWLMMAPIAMQLGHLLLADILWIAVSLNFMQIAAENDTDSVKMFDS